MKLQQVEIGNQKSKATRLQESHKIQFWALLFFVYFNEFPENLK